MQGTGARGLGEDGLLRLLLPHLPAGPSALLGPGDDAAVVAAADGRVVATTDLLVEGRDFRRDWSSGADVGWKAAAANLADVAAMGAVPTALLLTLGAPLDCPVAWLEDVAVGLGAACRRAGTGVVGGDLSAAPVVLVSLTALGDLQGRAPVRRDGARPGHVLALAGRVGPSAAGLELLRAGRGGAGPDADGPRADLLSAHRRPWPPLAAGPAAALAGASAMLDVSDGLGADAARLAAASGVHLDLDAPWEDRTTAALEAQAVQAGLPADGRARSWVRGGGEDHALLATFPAGAPLPAPFERIGEVLAPRSGGPAVTVGGDDEVTGGWDHFAD